MMATTESPSAADATSTYPDLASPTDSVIAGDFGAMSPEEQEAQREEWKAELVRTEEEITTLKQVLVSKEAHAAGLKRRLGITAWREFSEDMTQGLKNLQVPIDMTVGLKDLQTDTRNKLETLKGALRTLPIPWYQSTEMKKARIGRNCRKNCDCGTVC